MKIKQISTNLDNSNKGFKAATDKFTYKLSDLIESTIDDVVIVTRSDGVDTHWKDIEIFGIYMGTLVKDNVIIFDGSFNVNKHISKTLTKYGVVFKEI